MKRWVWAVLAGVALVPMGQAGLAQAGDKTIDFHIAEQPVSEALTEFGAQSGLTVIVETKVSQGLRAGALSGAYTAEEALRRLLEPVGLKAEYLDGRTVAVRAAGAAVAGNGTKVGEGAEAGAGAGAGQGQGGKIGEEAPKLEEIVVTAQKREQRLQDVPISISVLSGSALDQSSFVGVGEALTSVPGVAVTGSNGGILGGGMQLSVRGVTAAGSTLAGSSPVAYYLDGLPFSLVKSAVVPDADVYDLDRIEVLRGPQGTLYGANAQDGVVRVLTEDANLNDFDFKARASSSTTNYGGGNYRGDAAVNLPIIDGKLAARAVVGDESLSGWIGSPFKDHVNDGDRRTARFKLKVQPMDALSIDLSAWHQQDFYGAPGLSTANYAITAADPEPTDVAYNIFGAKVSYQFTAFSISSTSSYLDYSSENSLDLHPILPFLPENISEYNTNIHARTFSEELLLNSQLMGSWRWNTGVAYRNSTDGFYQFNAFLDGLTNGGQPYDARDRSKSVAVFGELARRLLENKLELAIGGRYFRDDVTSEEVATSVVQSGSFHANTPRVTATWYPTEAVTTYVSYSQGFRSGFPQDYIVFNVAPNLPAVKPDKLYNYELGTKATFWDQRLSLDTALYYIKWKDVQQNIGIPYGSFFLPAFINGQSASGPGIDFSVMTRPIKGLDIGVNFSWNRLTMDAPVYDQTAGGPVLLFAENQRLALSPEYTAGGSVGYSFPLNGFTGHVSVSANYTSPQSEVTAGLPTIAGDPIWISRAAISLESPSRQWRVTAFGDNLSNERGAVVPNATLAEVVEHPRPRTVGVQVDYRFGRP